MDEAKRIDDESMRERAHMIALGVRLDARLVEMQAGMALPPGLRQIESEADVERLCDEVRLGYQLALGRLVKEERRAAADNELADLVLKIEAGASLIADRAVASGYRQVALLVNRIRQHSRAFSKEEVEEIDEMDAVRCARENDMPSMQDRRRAAPIEKIEPCSACNGTGFSPTPAITVEGEVRDG